MYLTNILNLLSRFGLRYFLSQFYLQFSTRLQSKDKRLLASSCLSVCPLVRPSSRNAAPDGRIFIKYRVSIKSFTDYKQLLQEN